MKEYIYLLPEYANKDNTLHNSESPTRDEYKIQYSAKGVQISLTETNSLTEDEYSLNLKSAKYVVEGLTEIKESMIHHHKKGHKEKHLQFKLQAEKETIRIFLDALDIEDYKKCIKGFLNIAKDIILQEQVTLKIKDDLKKYFFTEQIDTLKQERKFLIAKIQEASKQGMITDSNDKKINETRLLELKKKPHLMPFFER